MLDPKVRVRTDEGGAPFEWMSVPSVKEVAIQPAMTDILRQPTAQAEKSTDTVLTTRFVAVMSSVNKTISQSVSLP